MTPVCTLDKGRPEKNNSLKKKKEAVGLEEGLIAWPLGLLYGKINWDQPL